MSRLLALGMIAAVAGCASGRGIPPGQDVTLAIGEQVVLPDAATLRYVGIAYDSRCPPDVQCIRAGDSDVLFDFARREAAPERITLNSERLLSSAIGSWRLYLAALAAGDRPRVTIRIQAEEGAP